MPDIRDLADIISDLYTRQRETEPNRNRIVQKYASVNDTVSLSSDTVTATVATPPYHWATDAASTATDMVWGLSEWS
ncbi:MAG: hypothetical protein NUW01_00410 [Gemmatimonadaceae bacterium]|nr:hypothetical protein [Gemmatimonadaceae bacterium]